MSIIEPTLIDQREIIVPSKLPMILKQFCKAAIRTQPYDLLKWSSSYFRALADGEEPPVKIRLEYPPPSTASGVTLGFLRVLLRQFGNYNKTISIDVILHRWESLCLDRKDLNTILMIGQFRRTCQVKNFLAIAVGLLGSNLTKTMIMICELFTHEPDGGSAMIPFTLFMELYIYLAELPCDGSGRDLFEHDTTENPTPRDDYIDHIHAIGTQDTDVNVNSDVQLIPKNETDLSKTDISTELIQDKLSEREICNNEEMTKESLVSSVIKLNEYNNVPLGKEDVNIDNGISGKFYKMRDANNDKTVSSETEDESDTKIKNFHLLKYYPDISGIGSRLTIEQVENVERWMKKCAKLQEGLVGPRNIRHTNCPPLHK